MKKNVWKKLIGKKSTGIIVTILTFVIVFGAIFTVSELTLAKDTLPGIVDIRNDIAKPDSEYRVLEIVPTLDVAEFGYLVGGEEPLKEISDTGAYVYNLYDSTNREWSSWQEYLAAHVETMDEAARQNYLEKLVLDNEEYIIRKPLDDPSTTDDDAVVALFNTTTKYTKPMWYDYYYETGVTPETADGVLQGGNTPVYGWLISDTTGGIGWNAMFTSVTGKTYNELVAETTPYYIVDTVQADGQVAIVADDITNSTYPEHYYTYKKDPSGNFYIPAVTFGELKADVLDGGLVDAEEETDEIGNYYIVKFKMLVEGDWTADAGPVVYEASNFTYLDANAPYTIPEQTTKGHNLTKPAKNIYYKGGLFSNELFKCQSLDIDAEVVANHNVNVHTVTPGELNAMYNSGELAAYLATVDFIYLNAGENTAGGLKSYIPGSNDILPEVSKAIFEKVCNEKSPCIVDNHLIDLKSVDSSGNISNTYAYALTCMLMQSNYRSLYTSGDFAAFVSTNLGTWATNIQTTIINNYNYVNGNVMVINSTLTDNELTDYYYDFSNPYIFEDENGDIDDSISADVLAAYKVVWDEIKLENLYRAADQTAGYAPLSTNVCKSTAVRYIINYISARSIEEKTSIEVLEIQPARVKYPGNLEDDNYGTAWVEIKPSTIRTWLGVDDSVAVNITTMTTNEFVGKIEDINSEYDMIYIGGDVYGMPRDQRTFNSSYDYWTNFSSASMDGMIYTNIGDIKGVRSQFAGQLDTDYVEDSGKTQVKNSINTRFSGNDISADKHNALVDYMKATYPIIVSDKLSTDNVKPSEVTLDNCSYLFSFLKENLDEPNVFTVREIEDGDNAQFQFYANRAKLSIGKKVVASEESSVVGATAFVQPGTILSAEDDPTGGRVTYITKETDGKFYLKYKFTITNNGAVYSNTKYSASLYLDSNSDGKYSVEFEEIPDITLTHVATGKTVKNGELLAGEQYTLTRQVPDSFSGLLNWKVEAKQADNPYIRDSITGHTKLNDPSKGPAKIKVLHVYKDAGSVLNLEQAIGNTEGYDGNNDILETLVWGGTVNYDGTDYTFDGITDDFMFEFTSIKNWEFNSSYSSGYLYKNGSQTSQEFNLMDYDMFVLGFYDSYNLRSKNADGTDKYKDIDAEAINGPNGIKEFIDSGKSVLFAHDTTSFIAIPDYTQVKIEGTDSYVYDHSSYNCSVWGYTLNKNIRDMVGLDAFGVSLETKDGIDYSRLSTGVALMDTDLDTTLMDALTNKLDENGHYKIGLKALAYKPGSNKKETAPEVQGLSYSWAELWKTNGNIHYRKDTDGYKTVEKAERVNEGQITTYPYYVPPQIKTATTHSQYFFLDLNADDDGDNETDLVVWYTLSGHTVYDASPRDVVNNYYIYNKGNITYTGIGHSANSTTIDEGKLFINTMVAAYNASIKEPQVMVYESEENLTPTTTFYEYGDEVNDVAFRTDTQRMYFTVNDMNVIRGTKVASAEYFVALKPHVVAEDATTYTVEIEVKDAAGNVVKDASGNVVKETKTYNVFKDSSGQQFIRLTDLKTYRNTDLVNPVPADQLDCGVVYCVEIPTNVFDIPGVNQQNTNTFMVAAKTVLKKTGAITGVETTSTTSTTYNKVDFVHVELFPLD